MRSVVADVTLDHVDARMVAFAAFGLILLTASVWSWRGRSRTARWWVRDSWGREFVLGMMPGAGLTVTVVGYFAIIGDQIDLGIVDFLLSLIAVAGFLLMVLGIFNLLPRFLEPSWYREALDSEERSLPADALGAVSSGVAAGAGVSSVDALSELLPQGSPRRPTHRWGANWVRDPDTLERDHGAAPRGAVPGRIELRPDSVGFAALALEDRIRGEAIAWAVSFDELTAVRLVPPRAGLDGIARRGILHRSLWKRLVLETDERAYLIDLRRPKKVLRQIEQLRRHTGA